MPLSITNKTLLIQAFNTWGLQQVNNPFWIADFLVMTRNQQINALKAILSQMKQDKINFSSALATKLTSDQSQLATDSAAIDDLTGQLT